MGRKKKDKEEKPPVAKEEKAPEKAVSSASGPKWIKVTREELMQLQAEHRLAGWNDKTQEALIK